MRRSPIVALADDPFTGLGELSSVINRRSRALGGDSGRDQWMPAGLRAVLVRPARWAESDSISPTSVEPSPLHRRVDSDRSIARPRTGHNVQLWPSRAVRGGSRSNGPGAGYRFTALMFMNSGSSVQRR